MSPFILLPTGLDGDGFWILDVFEQDCVDGLVVLQGIGDHDHGGADRDIAFLAKGFDSFRDGDAGNGVEVDFERTDTSGEDEEAADLLVGGEGEDGDARTQERGVVGGRATAGENGQAGVGEGIGELDGRAKSFLFFVELAGIASVAEASRALDAPGDAVKDFDALHGVFADRSFPGYHESIGFFEDGIGDVGDLGPSGGGVGDHGFEEVGGDDHAGGRSRDSA